MQFIRLTLIFVSAMVLVGVQASVGEPPSAEGAFPGENGKIAFAFLTISGYEIATVNPDGSELQMLGPGYDPDWLPDGKQIAFADVIGPGLSGIFVMDADGANRRSLTQEGYNGAPQWSPDGTVIAFNKGGQIWTIDSNGGTPHQVTSLGPYGTYPGTSWSPDGSEIAFAKVQTDGWGGDISAIDLGTGNIRQLTNDDPDPRDGLDWSPDGTKILFRSYCPCGADSFSRISFVSAGGGDVTHLAPAGDDFVYGPSWAPDGTQIVFSDGQEALRIINEDGSGDHAIPDVEGQSPDWQPLPEPKLVHSVEFTQGIQELQTLSELQASLGGGSSASDVSPQAFPGTNGKIAFKDSGNLQLWFAESSGANAMQVNVPLHNALSAYMAWSPDGRELAFPCADPGEQARMCIVEADGTGLRKVTGPGFEGMMPDWGPEGIIWTTGSGMIVTGPDGTVLRTIPAPVAGSVVYMPRWFPDGSGIAFISNHSPGNSEIWTADLLGNGAVRRTDLFGTSPLDLDISPDSQTIVFSINDGNSPQSTLDLAVINRDGTGFHRIITNGNTISPVWSPDGSRIAYVRAEGVALDFSVHTSRPDGSDETNVSGPAGVEGIVPAWQPLPTIVHSVEFTQGIQELQSISELQSDIAGDGQPPVPIVAGKPAAMRIYFDEVEATTVYEVEATGDVNGSRFVSLTPGCTPEQRRTRENNCRSVDFMFTPPAGDWSTTLKVRRQQDSQVLEEHEFNLTSVETAPLILKPVTVCDHLLNPATGVWNCGSLFDFVNLLPFLRATFPGEVIVAGSSSTVYVDTGEVADEAEWWQLVGDSVRALWTADGAFDNIHHYGVVRPQADAGTAGGVAYTLANAAAGKTSLLRDDRDGGLPEETAHELLAHLIGDNLGLGHAPSDGGCYGTPAEADPNWPNGASPETGEVGFDVAEEDPVPDDFADWTSFCTPRWISPYTANNVIDAFQMGAPAAAQASGLSLGDFWLVSGLLDEDAAETEFDPLFQLETEGSDEAGTGLYRIEVRDAGSGVLFTRFFEVDYSQFEDEGPQAPQDAAVVRFAELIPVQANAAKIVVISGSEEVGEIELGGVTPVVQLTSGASFSVSGAPPLPMFSWDVADADSANHSFWLELSHDGGQTWATIAPRFSGDTFAVDPAVVGGGAGLLLRIRASDGVNTGTTVSEPFNLQEQAPQGAISAPASGATFSAGDLVWLQAGIVDPEDGYLDGGSVTWSSSRDGVLGTGASLLLYDLSVGTHTISLFAKDSDNNELADSITITVSDKPIFEGEQPGTDRTWGDVTCDGNLNIGDAISLARAVIGLPVNQQPGCPEMSDIVEVGGLGIAWGDVDCNLARNIGDPIVVARHLIGITPAFPGCPVLGTVVSVKEA